MLVRGGFPGEAVTAAKCQRAPLSALSGENGNFTGEYAIDMHFSGRHISSCKEQGTKDRKALGASKFKQVIRE